jgi:hypothetical protein
MRTVKATSTILLVLSGLLVAAGLLWWFIDGRYHVWQVRFDPVAWKQADPMNTKQEDSYRTVRSRMIEDLLRHHSFDRWTRQQVIGLLGQPTEKWSGFEQWDMIYVLGRERGGAFSLDDEALGFKFDTRDQVVKYGLSVN